MRGEAGFPGNYVAESPIPRFRGRPRRRGAWRLGHLATRAAWSVGVLGDSGAVATKRGKALLNARGTHLERGFAQVLECGGLRRTYLRGRENIARPIDMKVVVQCIMRIDQAARLAIGSRERWETGLRVVERTGDQWRARLPVLQCPLQPRRRNRTNPPAASTSTAVPGSGIAQPYWMWSI